MKKFNLYVAIASLLTDLLAISLGLVIAYHLRSEGSNELFNWPFDKYLRFIGLMLPIWLILLASQGLYNVRSLPRGWNAFGRLFVGLLSGWGVMIITLYLWRSPEAQAFPRLVIAYGLFGTLVLTVIGRTILSYFVFLCYRYRIGLIKTVVLAGNNAENLLFEIAKNPRNGRQVLAALKSDYLAELRKIANTNKIEEIICADSKLDESELLEILNWAEEKGINFILVPSLLSVRTTNVEAGTFAGTPVLFFKRTPLEGWGRVLKRIVDIILVIPALIIASPFVLILATVVKLSSPGPVFYREPRVGQDGRNFHVYKFRSMYADWRTRFPDIKDWSHDEHNDPRVTSFGRIIRRTNLDELPQLWSVLIGTMSLVGPRPEQPKYVEQFSKEIPTYLRRHHVKSGLTGWAQINGARGNTPVADRVKYDLYYIENWSIWFDLRIILATFIFLFRQLVRPD